MTKMFGFFSKFIFNMERLLLELKGFLILKNLFILILLWIHFV